jgi:polyhydroxyalkanoate synthase
MTDGNGSANPWMKAQEAILDESFANFRRLARLPFLWQHAQRVRKGCTPSEVVFEEDRLKLLRYTSEAEPKYRTPLVFIFALVNRPYILDLKAGKSVVSHFVQRGFDTYLVDWGSPTYADQHLRLDDYINGYMLNVVDYVSERSGSKKVSVLAYCMGGTMSAMFTALYPQRVKNLILLAAGIDFATRDGLLNIWTDPKYFDVDKFVEAFGNCPAEFLQACFLWLKPVSNLIEKPINLFERLDDPELVDDFLTMETWLNDNIPVAGEVYREFVKYLYQQNLLTKNELPVGKHIVNLKNITCPVLNLMAEHDDLVPCGQSLPFNDLVSSTDRQTIRFPGGHIGLAVGSKAQRQLWPKVCDWLEKRSEKAAKTRATVAT